MNQHTPELMTVYATELELRQAHTDHRNILLHLLDGGHVDILAPDDSGGASWTRLELCTHRTNQPRRRRRDPLDVGADGRPDGHADE